MKKRIVQALLLSTTIMSLGETTYCVASTKCQSDILKMKEVHNITSGVSLTLSNHFNFTVSLPRNEQISNHKKRKKWTKGWATANVNVRSLPTTESNVYEVLNFNDEIRYVDYDKEWVKIKYKDDYAYVNKKYISNIATDYKTYQINDKNNFKSFMSYKLFHTSSKQYALQQHSYTGNYGIRMINGRYTVAIGTRFIDDLSDCIGTYFDVVLENGEVIPCVIGDVKANIHTDSSNTYTVHNGCFTEFIVDTKALNRNAKRDGNISSVKEEWNSPVDAIIVYDKRVEF